jgi:hypothetical protein
MVWKKIGIWLGKALLNWGANLLFCYVDKDGDGKISKDELDAVVAEIKILLGK